MRLSADLLRLVTETCNLTADQRWELECNFPWREVSPDTRMLMSLLLYIADSVGSSSAELGFNKGAA